MNACLAQAQSDFEQWSDYGGKNEGAFALNNWENPVHWRRRDGKPEITLQLPYFAINDSDLGRIVLLNGIGYRVGLGKVSLGKPELRSLCDRFLMPAFGDVVRNDSSITPRLYVKATGTLANQSACASASIAATIGLAADPYKFNLMEVKQPTGKNITVWGPTGCQEEPTFKVSAEVERIQ